MRFQFPTQPVSGELLRGSNFTGHRAVKVSLPFGTPSLAFEITYSFKDVIHKFRPDFLVRLTSGKSLILEIKGQDDQQQQTKRCAAGMPYRSGGLLLLRRAG